MKTTRWISYKKPIPLNRTLNYWLRGLFKGEIVWQTWEPGYLPILEGDPRFDGATLEMSWICHPSAVVVEDNK